MRRASVAGEERTGWRVVQNKLFWSSAQHRLLETSMLGQFHHHPLRKKALFLKVNATGSCPWPLSSLLPSSLFPSLPFSLPFNEVCLQLTFTEFYLGNGSIKLCHLIIVWLWVSHLIKLSLIALINKGNYNSPKRTVERNTVCEALITESGSICGNRCGLLCPLTGRRHWGVSGKQVKIPDLMKLS